MSNPRYVFITGTDTGVGKTVLTCLLLAHLQNLRRPAIAVKPFCSGRRGDAEALHSFQKDILTLDQINPFYFREPLAPAVAARKERRRISLQEVMAYFRALPEKRLVLIEGAGGLLAPLGPGYTAADLIVRLGAEVVVAAANRLGTINHTLLTVKFCQGVGIKRIKVALLTTAPMILRTSPSFDASRSSNAKVLAELLGSVPLTELPYLGRRLLSNAPKVAKRYKGALGRLI
ncbi:MAG TPA: dethiobiotin synthase [Candidatus Dormibacteraeota bacterium]|nr:dethiobiotin synthase [Candidatus Dormibacteraeota bacterium]